VRHYAKEARLWMLAERAAETVIAGRIERLVGKSAPMGESRPVFHVEKAMARTRFSAAGDPNGTRTRVFAVKGKLRAVATAA
jgi:hypothetical protein